MCRQDYSTTNIDWQRNAGYWNILALSVCHFLILLEVTKGRVEPEQLFRKIMMLISYNVYYVK